MYDRDRAARIALLQILDYVSSSFVNMPMEERMRRWGKTCSFCGNELLFSHRGCERLCEHCPPPRPESYTLSMTFVHRNDGWHCSFFDAGIEVKSLPIASLEKLYHFVRIWRGFLLSRRRFRSGVVQGRGEISLLLTPLQHRALLSATAEQDLTYRPH
jgi:hypothetical protein